ncbi:hypothetical protein, partial [Corallococcus exiguus]|uniref:hypothetical protein n=1 Tax=Corallococcus exiguus TaxID=83462 RepID=UPI001B8D05D9
MSDSSAQALTLFGGEFRDSERETAFQTERLSETLRHTRLLFILSAVLNVLFLISDWRFYGQPHFYAAVSARLMVVGVSIACYLAARRAKDFRSAEKTM